MDVNEFLTGLAEKIRLPFGIQAMLNHEFLGVSLLQIGLFACVLLFAWFMAGLVSYLVGRFLLRGIVGKFLPRFGIGMDRAVSGPLQLTVLCWLASIGSVVLVENSRALRPAPEVETGSSSLMMTIFHMIPRENFVYHVVHGLFSFGFVLSLFWIASRLLRLVWRDYMEPSVRGPERGYFPIVYRVLNLTLWIFAVTTSFSALGLGTREHLDQILSYAAGNNTVGQYLSFLGLLVLTILLARTLFTLLIHVIRQLAKRYGESEEKLERTWFTGLEQPLIYLITLIGARMACQLLNPDLFRTIAVSAIEICLTANVAWIVFILLDKIYENFLLPLSKASKIVEKELMVLARKTAKVGVALIAFVFMIKAIGQDPGAVLAGLGIGGLAVSFAAKDTISPMISGISIYLTKPFKIGDFVYLDDITEGIVEDIGLRATKLRSRTGTFLIVPNDKLTASVVQNRSMAGRTKDVVHVGLDISTPPQKRNQAIALFMRAVEAIDGAEDPMVAFLKFGDDSMEFDINYWVTQPHRLNSIRSGIMLLIDNGLRDIGVQINLPTVSHSFAGYLPGQPNDLYDSIIAAFQAINRNGAGASPPAANPGTPLTHPITPAPADRAPQG